MNITVDSARTNRPRQDGQTGYSASLALSGQYVPMPIPTGKSRNRYAKELGVRVKMAREAADMTQQDMADHLRLKLDTYQRYETGARQLPAHLIPAVCQVSGFGPWFMLTGQPDNKSPEAA